MFFIYGHCLLAGCGFTAYLKTKRLVNFPGSSTIGAEQYGGSVGGGKEAGGGEIKCSGTGGRWRRNLYLGALQVFEEGLKRFPRSARLLYGAALGMQVCLPVEKLLFDVSWSVKTHKI